MTASTEATAALGTFTRHGDDLTVRFERHYARPVETVWSALTEPERLADWMGPSQVDPKVGGHITMMKNQPRPMTGTILVWQPPRVLEFTWSNEDAPNSIVRYELTPERDGTRLVFTHTGMPYASCGLMLPGWHFLLGLLGNVFDGTAKPGWPEKWRELQGVYVKHYKLHDVKLGHAAAGA